MSAIYSPRKKIRRRIFGFAILAILLSAVLGGALFSYAILRDLPDPQRITERDVVQSTKIYDRTGEVVLFEIHGEEKRTLITLGDISQNVQQATLVAEDNDFYKHSGIDWRGIVRALIKDISEGSLKQGGSTITQQLVKNTLLDPGQTTAQKLRRKIREQVLAVMLERKYSKDEIMEMYLNQIPYGSNAYGMASAARTFFSKEAKDLGLAEAALLASLPKAPTYYSPYGSHQDELVTRKNWVLTRMAEEGYVSKEEAERAKKTKLVLAPPRQSIKAPHFVLYVREYLNEKFGEEYVERGGLRVITALDWKLQQEAEKAVKEGSERNEELVQAANASLVALDPRSGEILAMAGSRDYWGKPIPEGCSAGVSCRFDPHVNVATRSRQPGSAFKPFVYATAFKKGYTPETVLFDVPTEFNTACNADGTPGPLIKEEKDCYHPQNYDSKFRGPVSLRQALAQSLNLPSVKLLYLAGVKDSIDTAQRAGITTLDDPERYGLSLVLGGAEVKLLEMTSSFGAFAQDGILHPYRAIVRIEDSSGATLEEKKDASIPAIDTEIARTINDVLSDNESRVPVFSPTSSLYFPDRRVAAKTGTTQDYRDAWVVGYTPSLVAGVWVGNNNNAPMNQSAISIMVAGPIWHRFLEAALAGTPPEDFIKPSPASRDKPVFRGIYRAGPLVKVDKISGKLATGFTPSELTTEVALGSVVSILTHIKKEDPLGDPPRDPGADNQFDHWQAGINSWLSQNFLALPRVPQEYDDLHLPEKRPQIKIPELEEVSVLNASPAEINAVVISSFPLREVLLFINDELVDSKTAPILSEKITFKLFDEVGTGAHVIKITAYDAVGNKSTFEKSVEISGTD